MKEPVRCKLDEEDKMIDRVTRFPYLGITITSNKDLTSEVRYMGNKYLSTESKFIRNQLYYNSHDTWFRVLCWYHKNKTYYLDHRDEHIEICIGENTDE